MNGAGIVLCGGRSSRMGRAKAWLPWRGKPLVAHVVGIVRESFDEVVVVSSDALELPPLDARIVRDREPALGPLGGIREGLAAVEAERAFVTATDAPFLSHAFVEAVVSAGECAAAEIGGFVQPLAAVYPKRGLPIAGSLIEEGRMRPIFLLEALGYEKLDSRTLPDTESVRGFNTPDAYLEAVRKDDPDATASVEFVGRARLAAGPKAVTVPVGTLAEVLACAPLELDLIKNGRVAPPFLVSLDGRDFVRDTAIPIGPGERVIVLDSSVGG